MAEYPLRVYVPDLALDWLSLAPSARHRRVEGSMAFVDISGFTSLTERLSRMGVVGSEELSDILDSTFASLLDETRREGADLIKWGGDAVLLLFRGDGHAVRAVRAAAAMRRTLYSVGRTRSSAGKVTLRMSVGIHSGAFDFFLVGDPAIHRELIVSGPAASRTAELEAAASAGQIAVGESTAALLPPSAVALREDGLRLLRRVPPAFRSSPSAAGAGSDVESVAPVDAPVDPGISEEEVAGLLPPPVRAHLLAAAGESEHRAIAVAFVQFSGTDALLTEEGPDALAAALDDVVRNVQTACAGEAVTFLESDINRDGGKIMLVAGAPGGGEDVEGRMVRAVRLIVDRAAVLPLRIGVNRGRVFGTDFGPDFRRTYSVKGDAINVAARVMGHATPGQVLATREVVDRSGPGIATEQVEPFRVKGKSHPIQASLVLSAAEAWQAASSKARDGEVVPALIGREVELAAIRKALDDARKGSSRVVEIVGEAGLGKSALAREAVRLASGFVVAQGPSGRYGGAAAHQAVRRMLRDVIGVSPAASLAEQEAALVQTVRATAPALRPWLPLLAALLGVNMPLTPEIRDLDEQFRAGRQAEALVDLLRAALVTPTVLVFDGSEQMDDSSTDLVERVLAECQDRPWLVIATRRARPGGLEVGDGPAVVRLTLGPLDEPASRAMLESLTRDDPVSGHLLRAVAEKAGGNPLFLEALLESARASRTAADLPDSVDEVVGAEIDRLSPRARTVLRFAAVLGERFSLGGLTDLVRDEGWVVSDDDVHELDGMIERDGPVEGWYRFRNILIRDVAYAGLPYRLRRRMHHRVGEVLEGSGDPRAVAEALSTHFFEAGDHARSWTYSRIAGDQARQAFSYPEAMTLYQRAVQSATRVPDIPSTEVAAVYEAMGDVAELAGLSSEAINAYRRARPWAGADPLVLAGVMSKEIRILHRNGSYTTALRIISHARRLLTDLTVPEAHSVRSRLAVQVAFIKHVQARHKDALRWSRTAVEEAVSSDDPPTLAQAYNARETILSAAGQTADLPYSELALTASEEAGDLRMQAKCHNNLGVLAFFGGDWPRAEERFARAAALFHRVGDTPEEANSSYNRADVLIRQGRYDDAAPLLHVARRAALVVGDRELIALSDRELGKVRLGQVRLTEARRQLTSARESFGVLGLEHEAVDAELAIIECSLVELIEARSALGGAGAVGATADADVTGHRPPVDLVPATDALLLQAAKVGADEVVSGIHRVQGSVHLAAGRWAAARAAFEAGLQAPAPTDGGHTQALNRLGRAVAVERLGGVADRAAAEADLVRLGVVALPPPLEWDGAAESAPGEPDRAQRHTSSALPTADAPRRRA